MDTLGRELVHIGDPVEGRVAGFLIDALKVGGGYLSKAIRCANIGRCLSMTLHPGSFSSLEKRTSFNHTSLSQGARTTLNQ